jgi:general secretion pathway protein M
MTTLRQIFSQRIQVADLRSALANFGSFAKSGQFELGRSVGAVIVLTSILVGLLTVYWLAANSLNALQMNYIAREELLDVLQRRSEKAGVAMRLGSSGTQDPFLFAPTETLAASTLDDEIRRVASEANGTVVSSHPEVDHDNESAGNKIEIKAVIDGKIDALQDILFRLETGRPMVFVEEISLETRSDSIDGSGAGADPAVHMAATFVAYWHAPMQRGARR